MIGFAQIAGGAPSSVGAMTKHLLNNTVSQEEARLAAYYGRGMIQDPLGELAGQVAGGTLTHSDALQAALQHYLAQGGDPGLLEAAEARLGKRLADLAFRVQESLENAPVAILRPDLHPLAARGLGIDDPQGLLSADQINALLAERGYQISEPSPDTLSIREVASGVTISAVVEGDIVFFTLPCIVVPREKVTAAMMSTMLASDNGISTSYFQIYDAGNGNVAVTLNNFCKIQTMGPDDQDDILSCVHFLLVDVMSARGLLGNLAA